MHEKYYQETYRLVDKIISAVTEDAVCNMLNKYEENSFSIKRRDLIKKFIMAKIKMMKSIYKEGGG